MTHLDVDPRVVCYYCPICRQVFKENRSHHSWPIQRVICQGELVERVLVEPGKIEELEARVESKEAALRVFRSTDREQTLKRYEDALRLHAQCEVCAWCSARATHALKETPCPPT